LTWAPENPRGFWEKANSALGQFTIEILEKTREIERQPTPTWVVVTTKKKLRGFQIKGGKVWGEPRSMFQPKLLLSWIHHQGPYGKVEAKCSQSRAMRRKAKWELKNPMNYEKKRKEADSTRED